LVFKEQPQLRKRAEIQKTVKLAECGKKDDALFFFSEMKRALRVQGRLIVRIFS
jgi:hypothetical protein